MAAMGSADAATTPRHSECQYRHRKSAHRLGRRQSRGRGQGAARLMTCIAATWVLLSLLSLAPTAGAMQLRVIDSLVTGQYLSEIILTSLNESSILPIYLHLAAEELLKMQQLQLESLNDCRVCTLIDGDQCGCFDGSVADLAFYVLPTCRQRLRSLPEFSWLSIRLNSCQTNLGSINKLPEFYSTGIKAAYAVKELQDDQPRQNLVTLVLPLTLSDVSRALLLLESLRLTSQRIKDVFVKEMIVIVPDTQLSVISSAFRVYTDDYCGGVQLLPYKLRIMKESGLIPSLLDNQKEPYRRLFSLLNNATHSRSRLPYPYAIQMAIKLLVAKFVTTEYYITLDADLISLTPLTLSNLLVFSDERELVPRVRAMYENEPRHVHLQWWTESSAFLSTRGNTVLHDSIDDNGFGVTPAVLSTFGAMMTVHAVHESVRARLLHHESDLEADVGDAGATGWHRPRDNLTASELEYFWLLYFGHQPNALWSEVIVFRVQLVVSS
jgi:hypothetical protein